MGTGKNDFCKDYIKKKENDTKIKEHKELLDKKKEKGERVSYSDSLVLDYVDRISFYVSVEKRCPGSYVLGRADRIVIPLDQEDLDILYKKYSALLTQELEDNIAELKKQYE